jgi:hypothetical protein
MQRPQYRGHLYHCKRLGKRAGSLLQAAKRLQPLTMEHIKTGIAALQQFIAN